MAVCCQPNSWPSCSMGDQCADECTDIIMVHVPFQSSASISYNFSHEEIEFSAGQLNLAIILTR